MQYSYNDMMTHVMEGSQEAGIDPIAFLKAASIAERKRQEKEQAELAHKIAEQQVAENNRNARREAEPLLAELYRGNPEIANGRYDRHEIVSRLGLADTQGNRMWAMRRLTDYRRMDEYRQQGAASCQGSTIN